jgi:broad specificity phosphatase PhoE
VSGSGTRLFLLRHGEVASHRGDIPITAAGRDQAVEAGRRLAAVTPGSVRLLAGSTRRAQETAAGVRDGLGAAGSPVSGPDIAFALRNPDLYLAGARVEMVSSAEAFAAQVPWLEPADVLASPFFAGFLTAPDRIEFWLRSQRPPGDDAAGVATRIVAFARSLADRGTGADTVVAVTHSPVLRAVAVGLGLEDPGEPAYLTGYAVSVDDEGAAGAEVFDPFA